MRKTLIPAVLAAIAACATAGASTAQAADACPNAKIREQQGVAALSGCRAYELVSPKDKNGGDLIGPYGGGVTALSGASTDGERAMYASLQSFPQASNNPGHSYRASRTGDGWVSTDLSPNATSEHPNIFSAAVGIREATPDLLRGLTVTGNAFDPRDQDQSGFAFGMDVYAMDSDGKFSWVSRGNSDQPESGVNDAALAGHSTDLSHVIFSVAQALVPEDTGRVVGNALYDRSGGHTTLLTVDDNGDAASACGAGIGGLDSYAQGAYRSAVSTDGTRVVFTTPDPLLSYDAEPSCQAPRTVWVRAGDRTYEVSKSQRATPDPSGQLPAQFQGASADGSQLFFTSSEALTDDAQPLGGASAPFLYEFDLPAHGGQGTLKLLTPNAPDGSGPDVSGVVAISPSGDFVYFVTGFSALKLHAGDAITSVATGAGMGVPPAEDLLVPEEAKRDARIDDDGTLLFGTSVNVTAFDAHGANELYLYHPGDSAPRCISCNGDDHTPLGGASLKRDNQASSLISRNLLSGDRVFFESPDSLVPQDDNGGFDVYEWQPSTGARLISDGKANGGSSFVDTGADGRDVFFTTAGTLNGWDTDRGGTDLYDARAGGGFPEPVSVPTCSGDVCQGPMSSQAAPTMVGSVSFTGLGDGGGQGSRAPSGSSGHMAVAKPKTIVGSRASLKVKVPGKGRLSWAGSGLRSARRSVSNAASYAIGIRLTSRATKALGKKKSFKTKVRITYRPTGAKASTVTVSLTFKPAPAKKGR